MGLYGTYVLPHLIHWACGNSATARQRQKIVPLATGDVLELGVGTGLNLPFYDPARVRHVVGLDPSSRSLVLAQEAKLPAGLTTELLVGDAERLPMEAGQFDTVVVTYTLCTIPDVLRSLEEVRRVLKPGGRLLFCEHGLAPDKDVEKWQRRLQPLWGRLSGGCHLCRDIPALLNESGFQIDALETMYLPGWRFASFNFWGRARGL